MITIRNERQRAVTEGQRTLLADALSKLGPPDEDSEADTLVRASLEGVINDLTRALDDYARPQHSQR